MPDYSSQVITIDAPSSSSRFRDKGWKKCLAGVMMFLFDCTLGSRTLIGQKHLHHQELLNLEAANYASTTFNTNDANELSQQVDKLFMNDQISISLTVTDFSDLVFDPHANPGGFYYTVNLVDNVVKPSTIALTIRQNKSHNHCYKMGFTVRIMSGWTFMTAISWVMWPRAQYTSLWHTSRTRRRRGIFP